MATLTTEYQWINAVAIGSLYGATYYQGIYAKYSRTEAQKNANKSTIHIKVLAYNIGATSTEWSLTGNWRGTFNGALSNSWNVYATNYGTQTTQIYETSFEVTHANNGTYSTTIGATGVYCSYLGGSYTIDSTSIVLPQIPRYTQATINASSMTETSLTFTWTTDANVSGIYYSTDNGSTWSGKITTSGTSGTYTITKVSPNAASSPALTPNTTYNVKVKAMRSDSGLVSDDYASSTWIATTYKYPEISSVQDIKIGSDVKTTLYNMTYRTCTLTFYNNSNNAQLFTYQTSALGIITIPTTNAIETALYGALNGTSGEYYVIVTCSVDGSTHTSARSATGTIKPDIEKCRPEVSNTTNITESNNTIYGLTNNRNIFIRGLSSGKITIVDGKVSDTLDTNAQIVARYVDGVLVTDTTAPIEYAVPIVNATSYAITIKNNRFANDTSNVYNLSPTYHSYFTPTINTSSYIKRPSPTSDSMSVYFNGTFFNGYFDASQQHLNDVTIECYVRENETDNWTHCFSTAAYQSSSSTSFVKNTDYTISNNTYSSGYSLRLYNPLQGATQGKWSYQKKYYFKLVIGDTLYTALTLTGVTYPQQVGIGQPYFDWWRENDTNIFNVNGEYYKNGVPFSGGGGVSGDTLPIGSIIPYPTSTAPTNWLLCNGQAVSRTEYANLFAVIGTTYGSGDGSTTFNLPNLQGRIPVGQNSGTFATLGGTGGSEDAVIVSHTHTFTGSSSTTASQSATTTGTDSPDHSHTLSNGTYSFATGVVNGCWCPASGDSWGTRDTWGTTTTGGANARHSHSYSHTHTLTAAGTNSTTGIDGTGKNLQPYLVVNYIIKANQSAGLVGNVLNYQSTSTTDAYSSKYIDDHKQDKLVSGINIKTINNQNILGSGNITISGGGSQMVYAITEDMVTVEQDSTRGVSPYSTSYGYTNITIGDTYNVEWKDGAIYDFVINTTMVVASAYRNVRVRIGTTGNWIPLYFGSSIAAGSSYFTKAYNTLCTYKETYQSNGALHILSDNNTTYNLDYLRDAAVQTAGTGSYAVTRYSLLMQKSDMTWEKITSTSSNYSTGTSKSVNTRGFLLNRIRYYNTTTTVASAGTIAAQTLQPKSSSVDLSYSFNCGTTPAWNAGSYYYIVGTLGADGLFYLDTTTWWSNSLPSTNDGKLYIQCGTILTSNTCKGTLNLERPIYYHNGTRLCRYEQVDNKQDALISGTNIKTINNQSILGSGNITISGSGTSDYTQLTNKPTINNVQLTGNKTTADLGIPQGTVTQVTAGTGLSGGTITSSGTISLNAAASSTLGGIKMRVSGTTLYIRNDGSDA